MELHGFNGADNRHHRLLLPVGWLDLIVVRRMTRRNLPQVCPAQDQHLVRRRELTGLSPPGFGTDGWTDPLGAAGGEGLPRLLPIGDGNQGSRDSQAIPSTLP
jgi:hypothetical protein